MVRQTDKVSYRTGNNYKNERDNGTVIGENITQPIKGQDFGL